MALRPATEQDKRMVYEWVAKSDTTPSIMGPPQFPDHQVSTWEEFCTDYRSHYFDGCRHYVTIYSRSMVLLNL